MRLNEIGNCCFNPLIAVAPKLAIFLGNFYAYNQARNVYVNIGHLVLLNGVFTKFGC